jgi:hypothetical protein
MFVCECTCAAESSTVHGPFRASAPLRFPNACGQKLTSTRHQPHFINISSIVHHTLEAQRILRNTTTLFHHTYTHLNITADPPPWLTWTPTTTSRATPTPVRLTKIVAFVPMRISTALLSQTTAGVRLNSTSASLQAINSHTHYAQLLTYLLADDRDYARERSRSPQGDRDGDVRLRDEPSNGRGDRYVVFPEYSQGRH